MKNSPTRKSTSLSQIVVGRNVSIKGPQAPKEQLGAIYEREDPIEEIKKSGLILKKPPGLLHRGRVTLAITL